MTAYITPEQYAQALENGVSERQLYARVNYHGWDIEQAIQHEPGKPRKGVQYGARTNTDDMWYYVAKERGISPQTYHKRRKRGWTPEMAATEPLITKFHPMIEEKWRYINMDTDDHIQRGNMVRFRTTGPNPGFEEGEVMLFIPKGEDAYEMPRPAQDASLMQRILQLPVRRRRFQPVNNRNDRYLVAVNRKSLDGSILNSIDFYAPVAERVLKL